MSDIELWKAEKHAPVSAGQFAILYGDFQSDIQFWPSDFQIDNYGNYAGHCWFKGTMFHAGNCPYVGPGSDLCRGDLFHIADPTFVSKLDDWLEVDWQTFDESIHRRVRVSVLDQLGSPTGREAWHYVLNLSGFSVGYPVIPDGVWTEDRVTKIENGQPITKDLSWLNTTNSNRKTK